MDRLTPRGLDSMTPRGPDAPALDPDARELGHFGYEQQLRRGIGGFSSFAVAFSLISVLTGIFANFDHGLRQVGGAVAFSWLAVLVGQLLVAVVLAELAVRIPLSGYGYQWSSRLVNPHVGFFVGWLLAMQFLSGFPGVCATLARHLGSQLGGGWATASGTTTLSLVIIAAVTLVHLAGIRIAAVCNDAGVWAELVGVAALAAVLLGAAAFHGMPLTALADARDAATGRPAGLSAWALSLLLGAWCLTGFEAAADLAEETRQPRRVVPRAILLSLTASGVAGFLLLVGVVLSIPDLEAAQADAAPLATTLRSALGGRGLAAAFAVVGTSIFACALASMAATSRLLFSLARDRMLPGSRYLARIDPRQGTPLVAILFVAAVSATVVVALPTLEVITQISAVAGYLGYAGILAAALAAPAEDRREGFRLGAARPWVGGLALVWVLGVVAALTIPETVIDGITLRHMPAVSTVLGLLAGVLVYLAVVRGRLLRGEAGPPRRPAHDGSSAAQAAGGGRL